MKTVQFFHMWLFIFENQLFYCYYSYIRLFWTSNRWFSKMKSHKIEQFSTFWNILSDSESPAFKIFRTGLTYAFMLTRKFKNQQNVQFFDDCFAPKTVFWKKHYWVGRTIDYFEPVFGFLVQFCLWKHRSDTWDPKGMFSALSGRSASCKCNLWTPPWWHLHYYLNAQP